MDCMYGGFEWIVGARNVVSDECESIIGKSKMHASYKTHHEQANESRDYCS
jgi:hypothetical protein